MDHKAACLAEAAACRIKAEAEANPANRDYWVDEAIKWLERAVDIQSPTAAVSLEVDDGSSSPMRR
jgi:hypothetical protein